jgi:exopolysaccharide production protein ExoZ
MQQYVSIHYLRGLAAIMVCIYHIFSSTEFTLDQLEHVYWMRGGVDIFFVISGFVMVASTSGRQVAPRAFMTQRIQRIAPLYWIATLTVALQTPGQWDLKIQSLFFIPAMNPAIAKMQPILEPGWTLNYEMFFYLVFSLSLILRETRRFFAVCIFFVGLSVCGLMLKSGDLVEFYCHPIILEFVLGMAIAKFGIRLPAMAVPIGLLAMVLLQPVGVDRVLALGLPAALIVAGALSVEDRLPKWQLADLLGSASYSIYLFHLFAISMIVPFWPYGDEGRPMFFGVALISVLLVGCGIHLALEKPLIAFFASRKAKSVNDANAVLRRSSLARSEAHSQP